MRTQHPAAILTPTEASIIHAYRKSDQRGRNAIAEYATSMAEDWPAESAQPNPPSIPASEPTA